MIYLICALFQFFGSLQASTDFRSTVVTDPSISKRCEVLIKRRNEKVLHKQKLKALITRNKKVQKIVPIAKKSVKQKLQKNLRHLHHELKLTLTQVQHQEENIVRKGCPGIVL